FGYVTEGWFGSTTLPLGRWTTACPEWSRRSWKSTTWSPGFASVTAFSRQLALPSPSRSVRSEVGGGVDGFSTSLGCDVVGLKDGAAGAGAGAAAGLATGAGAGLGGGAAGFGGGGGGALKKIMSLLLGEATRRAEFRMHFGREPNDLGYMRGPAPRRG